MVSELQKLNDFLRKQHEGLVPKKVEVHPKTGKTFQRTQWVRPEEAEEAKEVKISPIVIESIHESITKASNPKSQTFARQEAMGFISDHLEPIYKEHGFDPVAVREIFNDWKSGSERNESLGFMSYLLMKKDTGIDIDKAIKYILDVKVPNLTEKNREQASEIIKVNLKKSKEIFDFHKKLIDSIIGDKKIVLYRGANGSTFKESVDKGSKLTINDALPISRWSLSKAVAHNFMMERQNQEKEAHILKIEVGADKIHYADGFSTSFNYRNEVEFGIDASGLDAEVVE